MSDEIEVEVFLTRRNLLSLLNKLDRNQREPGASACTLIKHDNTHPTFPQSHQTIRVRAIEDDVYYQHRFPGPVHHEDVPQSRDDAATMLGVDKNASNVMHEKLLAMDAEEAAANAKDAERYRWLRKGLLSNELRSGKPFTVAVLSLPGIDKEGEKTTYPMVREALDAEIDQRLTQENT